MKFEKLISLFLVSLGCFVCSSHCYTFYVGGKEGWVLQPKEKYNDWAGKQRFQINDTLIFKYEKGSDSVLLVKKDDYYKCEGKHPLMEMSNGTSEFKFPHSGPFFFISGKEGHCSKGQKMITVVMAERHGTPSSHPPVVKPPGKSPYPGPIAYPPKGSSPSPAHSPGSHGPVAKPPTGSTPYHHGPISSPPSSVPTGSPMAHGPTQSPAQSPYQHGPISSPPSSVPTGSPMAHGPTLSPAPSTHHAPQYGPSQSPVAYGPTVNPPTSTSPSSPYSSPPQPSTPTGLPTAPSTGSSSSPPAPPTTTPSPSGSQTTTPNNTSSATATYSSVLVLAAGVLFSMTFW